MDDWVIWILVCVALAVGEIATTSFFLGPFAIGALLAAVAAVAGAPDAVSFGIFAVVTGLSFAVVLSCVALAAALAWQDGRELAPRALAEWSRSVEVEEMGIAGGRQDHYAAAFGGALGLTFSERVDIDAIPISDAFARTLERRCLLAYTGESRISGTTITAVLDAYRDRVPRVLHALEAMRSLALHMRSALGSEDIDMLATLVHEHWQHQRALHPAITTDRIDAIGVAADLAGAIGMKALGASGGGCVIVFTTDDDEGRVARAIAPMATLLPWHVARDGVMVTA